MDYHLMMTPDDNDTWLVTCAELPEVTTFGTSLDECIAHGTQAVSEAVAARLSRLEDVPEPGAGTGPTVRLDLQLQLKVRLLQSLRAAGASRADLQRMTGMHRPQVDRLFDPQHASRLDQYDAAFRALGQTAEIAIRPL